MVVFMILSPERKNNKLFDWIKHKKNEFKPPTTPRNF
jgi:hypothetical protein